MTESFLYEADKYGSKSVGKEDGDTWDTAKGRAGKYKGQIRYFDGDNADDAADAYAKSGKVDGEAGDADKKDDKPDTKKGMDIDTTGGLGGDDKPKDKPKGERPATIHLDYDQADDDLDSLRYAGELSDNPGLVANISDMVKLIQSGHATDDDIQRATDIVDTMDDMDMTNPDAGVDKMSMALQSSIDAHVKGGKDKSFDPKSDGPHQGGSHFDRNDIEKIESPEELDDWIKDNEEKLNDEQREQLSVVMDRLKMAKKDYADDPDSYRDEVTSYWGTIEKIADMTRFESIKVINGKKYKAIKESVNKKVTVKEIKSWMKSLEEFRYRKIPNVDARRITSFVNNGLSETDLPQSLQKKWESAKYSKEKSLADRFMKERINKRLTQNESKHPIKERYDRLFKNKVVL